MHETQNTDPGAMPPPQPRRGTRMGLAALVLAGALAVVGVGTAFAADESTGASSSPAASESADTGTGSGTDTQAGGENCPARADASAEESSS
jgi:hypothetical protein